MLGDLKHAQVEFDGVPARTFFSYLLADTKQRFFSDPIHGGNADMVGWKLGLRRFRAAGEGMHHIVILTVLA